MTNYTVKRFSRYSDDELVARLLEFSKRSDSSFISGKAFEEATDISEGTITNHFGSWQSFCAKAGLCSRYQRRVSRENLFENLDRVWLQLGRQPRAKEMRQPLSAISISRYYKEFRCSWYHICIEFLADKSGASSSEIERESRMNIPRPSARKTNRGVSLSLRYKVLKRDSFRCVKCGSSPAITHGGVLHVDHADAWANGGETVLENLQTLCENCNLGKSNRRDA